MAEIDKDKLPFFLKESDICRWTGQWHANRRVMLGGELNQKSLDRTELELVKLAEENDEKPITLMIESGGGEIIPILQLGDMISSLNCPVDALVMGNCASAAVDLTLMCRKRMILPSARMLVHYVRHTQTLVCDDPERVDGDIAYLRERMRDLAEQRVKLYEKRTGLSREKLAEMFRHGEVHRAYFSATQAVEMKLVDEIVTDFKLFPKKEAEEKK